MPPSSDYSDWWNTKAKNIVHKMLIQITPVAVCWEVWKNRCACKFGDQKKMWHRVMENQIWWSIKMAIQIAFPHCNLGKSWAEMCNIVEKLKPVPNSKIVQWTMPPDHVFKVNTDGSFSPGKAGIWGIVRDYTGRLIMAFSSPLACVSNNHSEALAAKFGVEWCLKQGINNCILEVDSMAIVNILKNGHTSNLKLRQVTEDIFATWNHLNCDINHCYREANQVADGLAKNATLLNETSMYYQWRDIPSMAIGAYHLDNMQLPSVRIRYDKGNFFVS